MLLLLIIHFLLIVKNFININKVHFVKIYLKLPIHILNLFLILIHNKILIKLISIIIINKLNHLELNLHILVKENLKLIIANSVKTQPTVPIKNTNTVINSVNR
jgi:hypothetical protein